MFFKGPSSYTGEDVMECFTHGSRFILDALLQEIIVLGARPASPGEFTQRAFLNGKIDLIQAEEVADLIDSNYKIEAISEIQSMHGIFRLTYDYYACTNGTNFSLYPSTIFVPSPKHELRK